MLMYNTPAPLRFLYNAGASLELYDVVTHKGTQVG